MATFDTNTTPDIPIQSVSDVAAELAAIIVKEETNHLTLDPAPTGVPTTEGTLSWNDQDRTLNIQTEVSTVTQQVGQEQFVRCRNSTGSTISNGKVVYLSGSSGQRPTIALASRSTDTHVESTIGIATHDIANNSDGYVTTMGLVRGIVTTGLTEGAPIYLDTTAGSFTETRPTSGHVVRVGWVVVAGANGTVLVHAERLSTTNAFVAAAIAEDPEAIRSSLKLSNEPVSVANATARKTASTYTVAEVVPLVGLNVIQDDLPDVVWVLLSTDDITNDANWAGYARTNASGQLPLSGVKLEDGNIPFTFTRYIPAASPDWLSSSAAKWMRLFTGITIPGSLVADGNKVAISGRLRGRKDSSGLGTALGGITFQKASMWDHIEANPSTLDDARMPVAAIVDSVATLEWDADFHAIFTFAEVTGSPGVLRLVADTDLTDGGKLYSFTASSYAALAAPTADSSDSAGLPTNIPEGEDMEIVIGIKGGNNSPNKIHQLMVSGGINIWTP